MKRRSRAGLVAASVLLCGCATASVAAPREQIRLAVSNLDQDDFSTARGQLLDVVSACRSRTQGRRAMLLLAAADLDPANVDGSPAEAARAAAGYLRLTDTQSDDRVLARAFYRLALDRGAPRDSEDASPLGAATCGQEPTEAGDPLPARAPVPSTAQRMQRLQRQLQAQADSLSKLEQEIRRINDLLTVGAQPSPPAPRGSHR